MITGTLINDFQINGVSLFIQPTEHGWENRTQLGYNGIGNPIYARNRKYNLEWDYMDTEQFVQLMGFYNSTGTIVANLPKWNATPYSFYNYSGTVMSEPEYEGYEMNYYKGVKLQLLAIVVP